MVRSSYNLYDAQGNLAQRVNETGVVSPIASYTAWGEVVPRADGTLPGAGGYGAKYGYLFDSESGFYLCTYRHYDPSAGRWITRDPIGYAGGSNLYAYVSNNPNNMTDVNGLWGVQIGNGPNIGIGDPTFLFDGSSAANFGTDVEKGWYPAADGLNPFGDPYKDMGYWKDCGEASASYALGRFSQQTLLFAATGGAGAGARTAIGQKLFLSEHFGITSARFGNSVAGVQGSWNVPGRLLKMGWSSTPINGGGFAFRVGLLAVKNSNRARFHPVQWPFVSNGFGNGAIAVKRALARMDGIM